jgi:ParB family chromosome partitioning protein
MAGQNRKDQLKALFGTIEHAAETVRAPARPVSDRPREAPAQSSAQPAGQPPRQPDRAGSGEGQKDAAGMPPLETKAFGLARVVPAETVMRPRAASGAVKAMGLSLDGLSREVEEARRLKESLNEAERVVELDTALIDSSFVADRLGRDDDSDAGFADLVRSLESTGQQVPVLLRPHPEKLGRYQTAYGHRRIRAAARLGRPVKAIVRALTDTELVLAQGKENTERRDLSFIERAFFARALVARGFERGVVQDALSLHKAEMTRFLQVADAVPHHIADAIGPAPKIGRPRWMALAELLKGEAARVKAQDEITSAGFRAAASDQRFNLVFNRLNRGAKPASPAPLAVEDGAGRVIAHVSASGGRARVEFVDEMGDGFADYLKERLPELLAGFASRRKARP